MIPPQAQHLRGAFGQAAFGRFAERAARFLGTPYYIAGQTAIVVVWIALNGLFLTGVWRWDPYPYILLNLVFSTQAAYAAPLILLAATRQAERDRAIDAKASEQREAIAAENYQLLHEILRRVSEGSG